MPAIAWVLLWAAVITVVAVLAIREVRRGRRSADPNRLSHPAVVESELNRDGRGPNSVSQTWGV